MPQVVIEQPGLPPKTVPLSDGEISLGRAEDNSIVLSAEEVSRHHAKICCRDGKTILVDLKSMNGTYVNRQRIVERVLSHEDEIWFGAKCKLVFRDDTHYGKDDETFDKQDSNIFKDLNKIRAEMDRVGNSLTLIGKAGDLEIAKEDQPQGTPEDLMKMSKAFRRLDALYRASKLISSDFDLKKRLSDVIDTAMEVMEADRGFVLLHTDDTDALEVSVARGMGKELEANSPSMGIAGRAAIDGEPVLMIDADSDTNFGMRESIIRQNIRSAMCVPLSIEDRTLGSIYVDKQKGGQPFNEEDLELFMSLAAQSAMAIENVKLVEQKVEAEKERASLGRFLSPAVVEEIMKKDSVLELGGQKRIVTTMFADVRGFTQIGEMISAQELVGLLNEHFTAMTEIVFQYEGTLDKYNGDEVMALFGAPLSASDDAQRSIKAAVAMQARNAELNLDREADGRPTFEIGIGIASGEVIAGYIGSPDRLDFTVMGDRVNTASRFCSVAGPGQIVTGETTYELVKDIAECRAMGTPELKNKKIAVQAFEIVGLKI